MKKYFCLLLVFVLALSLCCFSACNENRRDNVGRTINSVNHRGFATAPENTLAAYRLSKEKGFSFVECDVSFTSDGIPVLLHDSTVNRTSDGSGKIRELTFEEVRRLDFGGWKSRAYTGEKIPSFEEFLDLCVQLELVPYVEVKGSVTQEEMNVLATLVDEKEIDVTWISFNISALSYLATKFPQGRFGYLVEFVTQEYVDKVLQLSTADNCVFLDCRYSVFMSSQIEICKANKVALEVWTVNSRLIIANLDPYISGVTSDKVVAQSVFDKL